MRASRARSADRLPSPGVLALGVLAFSALAFAHRDVLLGSGVWPHRGGAARWLFAPDESATVPVLALVAWMLWRRRTALRGAMGRPSFALAATFLIPALGLFVWAQRVASPPLLIPCMSLELLGFAAVLRGAAGCRVVALPAVALLLAMPLPPPLYNDVVWQLQTATTTGSALLLALFGLDVQHADAMIRVGDRALVVVEACSGLRGAELLLIVSLAIREVFVGSGGGSESGVGSGSGAGSGTGAGARSRAGSATRAAARAWVVVALAVPLAMVMNAVRVAAIALTEDPKVRVQVASGHLTQGIVVITAGTVVLYLVGFWMAGAKRGADTHAHAKTSEPEPEPEPAPESVPAPAGPGRSVPSSTFAVYALMLAAISLLPLRGAAAEGGGFAPPDLPWHRAGWSGTAVERDWLVLGDLPLDPVLLRRYERTGERGHREWIDVMIAFGDPSQRAAYPFSPKLMLPGPEWSLEERSDARIWPLDLEADLVRARSGDARAVAYHWRLGDVGPWRASLRAVAGLDPTPRVDARRPVVVRLSTPLEATGPVARARAKRSLDRFIADFRDELAAL